MIRPKPNSLNAFLVFNEVSIKELATQSGIERTRLGKLAQANSERELRYSMRVSELEALRKIIEGEEPQWINPTIPL
jgi:hypothetical protein